MILLCERCYGPVDPTTERYYRLSHLDHAENTGVVHWRDAVVHTEPCTDAAVAARDAHGRAA